MVDEFLQCEVCGDLTRHRLGDLAICRGCRAAPALELMYRARAAEALIKMLRRRVRKGDLSEHDVEDALQAYDLEMDGLKNRTF